MRDPGSSRYLLNLLLIVILTADLVTSTDTTSLAKQKAEIFSPRHAGQLPYTNFLALSEFTVCLDLCRTANANAWTAFSYCVENGNHPPELGLRGLNNKLEIFHMGMIYELEKDLKVNLWHSVCLMWKILTRQLEVYLNGTCVFNTTTKDALFKGNGSLVLGADHTRKGGEIILSDSSNIVGELYNYQMWNYTKLIDELGDCSEGNLIGWTKQFWYFPRNKTDENLRCANATDKPTSTTTTTTLTTTTATSTSTNTATPADNLSSTETLNAATTGISAVTTSPGIFFTTITQKRTSGASIPSNTTSTQSPGTLVTIQPGVSNTSTEESTTGSLHGNDIITNSSIILPTQNNASTADNTSSSHHIPPALRTTPAGSISPCRNHTTTQRQEPTDTNSTLGNTSSSGTVTTSSGYPTVTATDSTMNSSLSQPSLPTYTYTPVVTTRDPKISTTRPLFETESISSNSTEPPDGNLSSTKTSTSTTSAINGTTYGVIGTSSRTSSTIPTVTNISSVFPTTTLLATNISVEVNSSPSTVTTTTNKSLSSPSTALTQLTESPVSQAGITDISTSEFSKKPLPPNTVTFYVVQMRITGTDVIIDGELASMKNMMDSLLQGSVFSLMQIIVSDEPSNELGNVPTQKSNKKKMEINEDSGASNYNSKSIVRANSSGTPELLAANLNNLLENRNYTDPQLNNTSLFIQSVSVIPLAPGNCPSDSTNYSDGFRYKWAETKPTETDRVPCYRNPDEFATRYCYVNVSTERAEWENPNFSRCLPLQPLPDSFEDLENVTVTPENAKGLMEHILNMTRNVATLPENNIKIILTKLSEIIALGEIDQENAKIHLDVINFILAKADNSLRTFTNKILNITEEIGFKLNFPGDTANVTVDSMALLVANVHFSAFQEMFFTVKSYLEGKDIEISLEKVPADKAVAFIHLPEAIQDQVVAAAAKVQFNFFGNLSLFKDYDFSNLLLNTYIISASIEGTKVEEMKEPVGITVRHIYENTDNFPVKCAFWDFSKNSNLGGWNTYGCSVTFTNMSYTSCYCNHLTHFGVLLDISRTSINPIDDHILSLLTYVGCGIASLFLGVSLVTYGMFKQLRRDYPSKILMNLSFSLLMLNLLFLVNNWLSSFRSHVLCISTAALLHYFLLTSFTWMGLEAVHMYFAFVKVFNSYIHKYILKLCIAGWGIPTIVVVVVLSIDTNFYGSGSNYKQLDSSSQFCWIQNDTVFYVAVVAYFGVTFLTNISMFIVVLLQIKSLKSTRLKDWKALFLHDIKNTLSLAVLLGLTWGFAFFAWGPVRIAFLYLFAIFNTLQGFFIFLFHCLIKENVRKHWRMDLCCGRCRLDNYSDWSRLSNVDTRHHGRIHLSPSDSYQSTRSNNTASTNSSSLSGFSRDDYYGKSYVNGGGIFISSVHTAPSNHATVYPDTRRILSFLDLDIN